MSGSVYSMAIRRLSINRKSLIVFLKTQTTGVFHWILNSGFSLLHNAVPLLLSIRLAQVYSSWEVSWSTFPYSPRFVFSDQVWSNFVLYDQLWSRRGSELFTFSRAFCYCWVNPSARLKQNIWNLLMTPNYIGLLCKEESIFKRITCGPWGEPKKSISPPAPVEPPGFLQGWLSEMLEVVVVQSCPQWNQFMNATFMQFNICI